MNEKIEEIVNKYTNSPMAFDDGAERVTFQERYFPISDLVNEISTLIQEERKEAVRGFADWWNEGVLDDFYSIDDNDTEAYLQSLDKGDKITSNTLTITEEELENASYTSSTIESEGKK